MPRKLIASLMLVLLAASVAAPAAAQSVNNSTATPVSSSTPTETPTATPAATTDAANVSASSTDVVVGPLTRVTEWSYTSGTFDLTIEADAPVLLTISESPETRSSGSGTISFTRHRLSTGTNTVSVPVRSSSDATIILSTPGSVARGEAAFIRHSASRSFISGPFSGSDVRNAGIGGALGVVIAVLYEAVSAKVGSSERGERVA